MENIKSYNTTNVFVAACAGLSFFGVAMLSLGALLPPLIATYPQATTLAPTLSAGIILGTIIFGPIMDKFGYKWLLICGTFIMLAGILGLTYLNTFYLLTISIFLLGTGAGILNGETNALVSYIYDDDKRGSRLSILGACYCLGALLWTLACALISDYKIPLMGVAILMGVSIFYFILIKFPKAVSHESKELNESNESDKPSNNSGFTKKLGYLLSFPAFIALAFVLFLQSGFEGVTGSFSSLFFVHHGIDIESATFSLTMFTIGMLIGRIFLSKLMSKLKDFVVFNMYLSVGLVGIIIIWLFSSSVAGCFIGMTLLGFGLGASYPVVFNVVGEKFRHVSGSAFSIIIFIALWGQFAYNAVTGAFFSMNNFTVFPIVLIINIILMIIVAPLAINSLRKNLKLK